jgi:hypothetical protein
MRSARISRGRSQAFGTFPLRDDVGKRKPKSDRPNWARYWAQRQSRGESELHTAVNDGNGLLPAGFGRPVTLRWLSGGRGRDSCVVVAFQNGLDVAACRILRKRAMLIRGD